ncbi:MAG: ribosomal RNA small subunit methyltransferase A [Gemmatimonadales bacterium]|nr:MAG: ribosomal RNA small subunit methyltransferase A [Gemmatimonadales bacterium]
MGQNFLVDPNLQRKIVEAVGVEPGETVLEIGPGQGALTQHLAEVVDHLLLVELDRDLAADLVARYQDRPSVEVIQDDILNLPLGALVPDPGRLRVVGNIPYNLTTPILFHLLERPRPREILLMVQREVADRVLATPGGKEYGALSVGVQTVAQAERVLHVPPGAFRPRPKVDSTVLRIRPLVPPPLEIGEEAALRRLTRAAFQWRRKQMGKILRDHPEIALGRTGAEALLGSLGVDFRARPETLAPETFIRLSRELEGR